MTTANITENIRQEWNRRVKPQYRIRREKRALEALREEYLRAECEGHNRMEIASYMTKSGHAEVIEIPQGVTECTT